MKKITQRLNIAVMGCASIAQRSMIPAISAVPEWRLVAIASRSCEKAENFAGQFNCDAVVGYENLLKRNDVDAIYMPLPTGLHYEWITKSLMAGKHVLAEKSIAADYSSACRMVELARENNLVLMENFMFQYHSQHQFVFDMIRKGEIGEVRVFRANFAFPPMNKSNFRYDDKIGGGALLDAAGYTVRAVHFVMGDDFVVKAANLYHDPELKTNIYGGAFLDNGKGISAQIAFGMDHYYQCNYEIWGSKGKITVDRAFTPKPDYSPLIVLEKQGERHEYQMKPDNHFIGSIKEFHRTIVSGDREKHYHDVVIQSKTLDDIRRLSENHAYY
ncbi:MAG TPA: Gfo/Idh/MocA family oxidoreductase [Bacteroidales bacterium]|nr:Gfo/Idh/MocA family oxidoreductase [Bacteroidales bacterium]HPR57316.1 Gfo/Idh/MocA family oxidoreductase [Bacteroidales bacterium]HRW97332.1 Gfo/Idh/MocA family oxidoreductase [Bacteroidales bacterium]